MTKEQINKAVIGAAKRLSTGNNEYDTYGMDVEILRKHALDKDFSFVAHAVQRKIHQKRAA
jgi:hypothetical protein